MGEYAALLKEYRVGAVSGDNYSAAWVEEAFKAAGVKYVRADKPKSQLYLEALPQFARGTISIPDHPRLLRELRLLERRTHRSGKDTIDHGRSGHDDLANSLAAARRSRWRRASVRRTAPWSGCAGRTTGRAGGRL